MADDNMNSAVKSSAFWEEVEASDKTWNLMEGVEKWKWRERSSISIY